MQGLLLLREGQVILKQYVDNIVDLNITLYLTLDTK